MGTYDHVEVEIECPECGEIISGFQTKDGPRQFSYLHSGSTFDRWWMEKPEIYKDYYNISEFLDAYSECECGHRITIRFSLILVVSNIAMIGLDYKILENL